MVVDKLGASSDTSIMARVVKLVDTQDLKSCRFRAVPVRPRPRAPSSSKSNVFLTKNSPTLAEYLNLETLAAQLIR